MSPFVSGVRGLMTNRDVQDMLQFFTYSHLPPNLQGMSKLFADLAHGLGSMTGEEAEGERGLILTSQARSLFTTLIGEVDRTTPPNYQATRAVIKVGKAKDAFAHGSELMEVLNFLLEGKDCAVRALLFKVQPQPE